MDTPAKRRISSAEGSPAASLAFLDMKAEIGDLGGEGAGASDSPVMILTCPECATSYFVDDGRIPRRGRTVKCSSCGARWKALPEGVVEDDFEPPSPRPVVIPEPADDLGDEIDFVAGPITPVVQAAARYELLDFVSREPSLEETFLAQYGHETVEVG